MSGATKISPGCSPSASTQHSEEDATAILDAVIARMNGLYETIESTVGHHSITLLSRTSSITVSTDLRDQQQNTRDNLTSLQNQMTEPAGAARPAGAEHPESPIRTWLPSKCRSSRATAAPLLWGSP